MPCLISASTLFCVDTRGVDSTRPLPVVSSADSATSRLNAPLTEPSCSPTALGAPATGRLTAVGRPPVVPPVPPDSDPLLGNARFVVLPSAGSTRPLKPHCTPRVRWKFLFTWTMRASISTCGCALSSTEIKSDAFTTRSGRSVMIRVFVRGSTCTVPRADSTLLVRSACRSSALA